MASPEQIALIVQLRGLGHNLEEIAKAVKLSKSTVAYHLKQLKERSEKGEVSDVFLKAILGGITGAAGGIAAALLIDQLMKKE